MKKNVLLVALLVSLFILNGCSKDSSASVAKLEILTNFGELAASDAEYTPNKEYDKYTLIEYYLEDADATLLITCSAKANESEYYMEYSFYGDDQEVICNNKGEVSFDKTGFMSGSTPDIVKAIQEQNIWSAMPQ